MQENNFEISENNKFSVRTGESEIDLLVTEELYSSEKFQRWLLNKLGIDESFQFIKAWKSYLGKYGECDIATLFEINNSKVMILIENKIYSSEQPDQAKRYHKTGKYLLDKNEISKYITCLLSPEIYFNEEAPMKQYQKRISYEELLEFFNKNEDSKRIEFKKMVIKNGIERARTGYVRVTEENTDKFYEYFEMISRENFPQLEYRKPKEVAGGNPWIRFNPKSFPPYVTIVYKANRGDIDLQISEEKGKEIIKELREKLLPNMRIYHTGKSQSIRVITKKLPELETIINPEDYKQQILDSLNSVNILFNLFSSIII